MRISVVIQACLPLPITCIFVKIKGLKKCVPLKLLIIKGWHKRDINAQTGIAKKKKRQSRCRLQKPAGFSRNNCSWDETPSQRESQEFGKGWEWGRAQGLSSGLKPSCSALLMSELKLRPLIYETDTNQYSTITQVRASFECREGVCLK